MSKLYKKYLELKSNNKDSNTLYLFKSGIFYIFLEKDAELASVLLHLKLTKLNDNVYKCGFPATHIEKYIQMLELNNYKTIIVKDDSALQSSSFLLDEALIKFIDDFLKKDIDFLSVSDAYQLLYDTKDIFQKIKNNKIS